MDQLFPDSNAIFVTDPGSGADFVEFSANGSIVFAEPFSIPGQGQQIFGFPELPATNLRQRLLVGRNTPKAPAYSVSS